MISRKHFNCILASMALIVCAVVSPALAANTPEQTKAEIGKAAKAADAATKQGPADISFAGQATFHLPKDFGFIPAAESKALLEAIGNRVGDGFIGLIVPSGDEKSGWFVAATYNKSGYVKDDDAKDWKADELLKDIRTGTEETNKSRKERGIPEMDIVGWVEKPTYDAASHRLVWSIASRDKGQPDTAEQGINYNTLALGREGYISMNLVTDRDSVEGLKPVAQTLLGALEFNSGKRYADFNASTDKVAAYGLAAIVAGVAAKKLGLLAIVVGFVAKFAKVIIIAAAAGFGGFFNRFRRKKEAVALPPAATGDTPPAE
jgi:uncharacterized membrane-anchored protein